MGLWYPLRSTNPTAQPSWVGSKQDAGRNPRRQPSMDPQHEHEDVGLGGLTEVGGDCSGGSVESDDSTVGEDPLGSGVAEGDPDADDGVGVVEADLSGDCRALIRAYSGTFVGCGSDLAQAADGRAGDQDARGGFEDSPFTEGPHPPHDVVGGRQILTGLEKQDRPGEIIDRRHPTGHRDLGDHFQTPTLGPAFNHLLRS